MEDSQGSCKKWVKLCSGMPENPADLHNGKDPLKEPVKQAQKGTREKNRRGTMKRVTDRTKASQKKPETL